MPSMSKGPQYAFNKNSLHHIPESKSQRPEILKDVLQSKTTVMLRFRLRQEHFYENSDWKRKTGIEAVAGVE